MALVHELHEHVRSGKKFVLVPIERRAHNERLPNGDVGKCMFITDERYRWEHGYVYEDTADPETPVYYWIPMGALLKPHLWHELKAQMYDWETAVTQALDLALGYLPEPPEPPL